MYLFFSNVGKDYTKKSDLELIHLLGLHKNNVSAASKVSHERHMAALKRMAPFTAEMKRRGLIKEDSVSADPALQRTLKGIAQKQFSKSVKDINALAANSDPQALYQMAMIFRVSQEAETSLRYMTKSAEAGYVDAQYALGWAFLQGNRGKEAAKKAGEALKWFKIASEQGHVEVEKAIDVMRKSVSQATIDTAFNEARHWFTQPRK